MANITVITTPRDGREIYFTPEQCEMLAGKRPMLVYVAGPYSVREETDNTDAVVRQLERNLQRAVEVAEEVLRLGHYPFIPHTHTNGFAQRTDLKWGWSEYLAWDEQLLTRFDAILKYADCPGSKREYERARKHGLLLFQDTTEMPKCHTSTEKTETR